MTITNLRDLCEYFSAEQPWRLNKNLYKATNCGASLSLYVPDAKPIHNGDSRWHDLPIDAPIKGFTIQTIVEGSDAIVDSELFTVPVESDTVEDWIQTMEREADIVWREANDPEEEEEEEEEDDELTQP